MRGDIDESNADASLQLEPVSRNCCWLTLVTHETVRLVLFAAELMRASKLKTKLTRDVEYLREVRMQTAHNALSRKGTTSKLV